MLRRASSVLLCAALSAGTLMGCYVTGPGVHAHVGVDCWYYPLYDVYYRGGRWWYYGVDGWIVVDTLPSWIVIAPGSARVRVGVPPSAVPYRSWERHRVHRSKYHRARPRVWRPAPLPHHTPGPAPRPRARVKVKPHKKPHPRHR